MTKYYTAVILFSVFAMIAMEVCVFTNGTLTKSIRKKFVFLYLIVLCSATCEWLGLTLQHAPAWTRIPHVLVKGMELSIAPFIGWLFASIVGYTRLEKPIFYLLCLHSLVEWVSGIFGFVYVVDMNNVYMHGHLYWIYVAAYILGMVYAVYTIIANMKKYQYNGVFFLLTIVLFILAGITVQLKDNNIRIDWMVMAFAGIMLYIFNSEMVQLNDPLTTLINRRGYENYLTYVQQPVAILFFDVDKFKEANDNHGHNYGDHCLKVIGTAVREIYGHYGKCFRIGGDEFCVIMKKNLNGVAATNTAFFHKMTALRENDPHLPFVSVGYVIYDPEKTNVQDAVDEADRMMYGYKELHHSREKISE